MQFIANNVWKCQLNSVSRVFEARHPQGPQVSCHLSQPEVRLLEKLLENANTPVARQALIDFAWGGRPVASGSLNHAIFNLRNAFGQGEGHKVIQTVPNKGYKIRAILLNGLPGFMLAEEEELATPQEQIAPAASAPPPWTPRISRKCLALLLAINVGLALATYWVIERKVDTTIPTLSYAPLKKTGDTEYFTRQSLPQDERLAKAVDALAANPSALSSSRPFVYINAATSTGQYSYFLCDRAITENAANCGAYVIESTEVL
ncbi:transcriptional regulator [Pseudomonas sp. QL9]|uniref:winged helix-turn-helix domain-containing protein n=1 Tax=Pseudomonas sp. QL9 TaxID=3242725 RepID=UPI00352A594D